MIWDSFKEAGMILLTLVLAILGGLGAGWRYLLRLDDRIQEAVNANRTNERAIRVLEEQRHEDLEELRRQRDRDQAERARDLQLADERHKQTHDGIVGLHHKIDTLLQNRDRQ